jgi:methionyl-tRNA formyltransferase
MRCLELARNLPGCEVVGVVTAPQTFSISYRPQGVTNVLYADVPGYASAHGLPHVVMAGGMDDPMLVQTVKSWLPDCFLVAGWYHMVPRAWRALAPAYGLHASLLPNYSGGAPLVWAMINGEPVTGITLFQMDDGVDTGPVAGQAEEQIRADDTIATLYERIEDKGLALLAQCLPAMARGSLQLKPQPQEGRRVMPQRSPEDGLICWDWSVKQVDRFIRAQTKPYPGAFAWAGDKKLTIWSAEPVALDLPHLSASGLVKKASGDACLVACLDGWLRLREVMLNGQPMSFGELHGFLTDRQVTRLGK